VIVGSIVHIKGLWVKNSRFVPSDRGIHESLLDRRRLLIVRRTEQLTRQLISQFIA
jgi:hypothetical protein